MEGRIENSVLAYRMLLRLPLALVGWDREEQIVKLPLFKKFRERSDMPFCNFRAALQVCSPHRSTLLQFQHSTPRFACARDQR